MVEWLADAFVFQIHLYFGKKPMLRREFRTSRVSARWSLNMADFGQKPCFFFVPRPKNNMVQQVEKINFFGVGGG